MSRSRLATWSVVLSFLFIAAPTPTHFYDFNGLGIESVVLSLLVLLELPRLPGRKLAQLIGTFLTLLGVVLAYFLLRQIRPQFGTESDYLLSGLKIAAYLTLLAAYVRVFFEPRMFIDVFWRAARLSLGIAIVSYAITIAIGSPWLTNSAYDALRAQGFLSEPSAWAPVVSAVLILSIKRKDVLTGAMALLVGVLAKSPTVMLVAGISLPAYYVIYGDRRSARKWIVVLAMAIALPAGAYQVQRIDPDRFINSGSPYQAAFGRLISGIHNVQTSGAEGKNDRFQGGQVTIDEVRANGWQWTGYGLASVDVYLPKKFDVVQAWSLFFSTIFSFGYPGTVALIGVIVLAVSRMRDSDPSAIFLPFIAAAMVNSASGWVGYQFTILAMMAYGLRWFKPRAASQRASQALDSSLKRSQASALPLSVQRL